MMVFYLLFVQDISKMLRENSGMNYLTKTRESFHINVCPQTSNFLGTAPKFARTQSFSFVPLGTFQTVVFSSVMKNK